MPSNTWIFKKQVYLKDDLFLFCLVTCIHTFINKYLFLSHKLTVKTHTHTPDEKYMLKVQNALSSYSNSNSESIRPTRNFKEAEWTCKRKQTVRQGNLLKV